MCVYVCVSEASILSRKASKVFMLLVHLQEDVLVA